MKIHEKDIVCAGVNGIQLKCAGILDGEIVLQLNSTFTQLYFLVMASDLDTVMFQDMVQKLAQQKFPQCIYT